MKAWILFFYLRSSMGVLKKIVEFFDPYSKEVSRLEEECEHFTEKLTTLENLVKEEKKLQNIKKMGRKQFPKEKKEKALENLKSKKWRVIFINEEKRNVSITIRRGDLMYRISLEEALNW